jgi:hypothetical protein
MRHRLPLLWLLAICPAALAQTATKPETLPFATVAAQSFDAWDADHNGILSPEEIDHLSVDPHIKGERAAALAAMKLVVRSAKITPPVLTRDFVEHHSKDPAGDPVPDSTKKDDPKLSKPDPDAGKPAPPAARPPPSLERRYQTALRRIRSAKPDLFADGSPDINHCHQGPLGDCFFVAGVGAYVHRDPEAIKKMIRENHTESGDTTYTVTFGSGDPVTIPALTDTEFALTSTTGGEGVWLQVLEKAYGSTRNKSKPESKQTEEASDAIARGGSLGTTLRVFTGHAIDRTKLRSAADKDSGLVDKVKNSISKAVKDKRLAGASTGSTTPLPPGINGKHAYAILGYDESAGLIELWNPHGNTFHPKGDPGLEHGYETKAGVFKVPTSEFVKIFESLVIETDHAPEPRGSSKRG